MKLKKLLIIGLATTILTAPVNLGAFVNTENSSQVLNFYQNTEAAELFIDSNKNINLAEFIRLLFESNGVSPQERGQFKFNDVPGDFEAFAEKARLLGLVSYNPEYPVFGYDTEISVSRALDIALKYYGLAAPRLIQNTEFFKSQVLNYNPEFMLAPLIERGLMTGALVERDKSVNILGKISRIEAATLIFSVKNAQSSIASIPMANFKTEKLVKNEGNSKLVTNPKFKIFEDVYQRLSTEYYDQSKINLQQLILGAISGMVNQVDDSYTEFQLPEELENFRDTLSNQVEGIGASLGLNNQKKVIIISPLSDSPAQKAGLKSGDLIQKINSEDASNMSLNQVVSRIKGPAGTSVSLEILRNGAKLNFEIQRAAITVPSVTGEINKDNIGVVTVRNFGLGIEDRFASFMQQFKDNNVKSVVIDLRNNPGGYLDAATDMAGHFIDKGKLVSKVQYVGSNFENNSSRGDAKLKGKKIVVIINKGSASAAEILAAALRDQAGAILVGETTFGKGTVQELITYSDNSALKITVANWLTPNGINVNKVGVKPTFEVIPSQNDIRLGNDPQMNKALIEARK